MCAINYALQLKYKSAGTIEFLVDDKTGDFFFLEMNTRLQVEHGITELCYRVDLVALMLQQADCEKGGKTGLSSEYLQSLQKDGPSGAAIEVRVYAEVPFRNYAPSPGLLQYVDWPTGEGVRVDTWVKTGQRISANYGMYHEAEMILKDSEFCRSLDCQSYGSCERSQGSQQEDDESVVRSQAPRPANKSPLST